MTSTSLFPWLRSCALPLVAAFAAALPLAALADPPSRAARLSYVSADASFAPSGSDEWLVPRVNRPLWIGDRLWSANGNVELQFGGAALRLAPRTAVTVLNFDDRIAQFEVTEGSVVLNVRAIDEREGVIEIATPSLAFVVRTEGDYRVDVEREQTAVGVRRGWAEVWGTSQSFRIDRREQFLFYDADLRDYDVLALPAADTFERWARERARREEQSVSARYVSPELVGYVDLDQHGEWRTEGSAGAVWYPRVEANWAPYRYGRWSWIDPWGWTWVDDAPWGFAPFHYGRWTQAAGRWGWVPGPREVRPVYAPALVAWVGGDNFSLSIASGPTRGVAWYPLAPGEVWRPAYEVSREYFTRVNVSNTYVNQTTVVNVFDDVRGGRPMRSDYRYRSIPSAVTAVPVEAFVQSRPIQRNVVNVNTTVINQTIQQAPVAFAPAVRPEMQSFVGQAPRANARPPAETMRRTVMAREAPPAAVPTLQDRVNMVRERGQPVDRQVLDQARPAPAATAGSAPSRAPAAPGAERGGSRAAAEQAPRAPNELRSGVRVVGGDAKAPATTALPPSTRAPGATAQPRAPAESAAGRAAQPRDNANGRGSEAPREAETRPDAPGRGREGSVARPDAEAGNRGPAPASRGAGDRGLSSPAPAAATPANRPPAAAASAGREAETPRAAPGVPGRGDGSQSRTSPDERTRAATPAGSERAPPAAAAPAGREAEAPRAVPSVPGRGDSQSRTSPDERTRAATPAGPERAPSASKPPVSPDRAPSATKPPAAAERSAPASTMPPSASPGRVRNQDGQAPGASSGPAAPPNETRQRSNGRAAPSTAPAPDRPEATPRERDNGQERRATPEPRSSASPANRAPEPGRAQPAPASPASADRAGNSRPPERAPQGGANDRPAASPPASARVPAAPAAGAGSGRPPATKSGPSERPAAAPPASPAPAAPAAAGASRPSPAQGGGKAKSPEEEEEERGKGRDRAKGGG